MTIVMLIMAAMLAFAAPAAAQTFPALTGRVVDQANIIPDDREAAMTQQLEQLQRATSRQLVVATVASLDGLEIQDYSVSLFRAWRLGQAEANNGALLLVAPNERRVWITTGYGLEGILTDAFTGRVVRDQIVPRFRENDYPGGIENGVNALIIQLAAPPEQAEQRALEAERARDGGDAGGDSGGAAFGLILFLFIFGLPILIGVIGAAGNRRRPPARPSPWGRAYAEQRGGGDGSGLGWLAASIAIDVLTSGRGGGGSSWGGGGGSSWGGGGGGFSGGGGSSGGGGAGGSW